VIELMLGDCLEMMRSIPDNSVDLCVTSPPYFNAKEYSQYKTIKEYLDEMKNVFSLIYKKTKLSRMCVINISPVIVAREKRSDQSKRIPLPFYIVPTMESIGFEFLEDIIWEKPDGAAINRNGGFYRHRKPVAYKPNIVTEYILVFKKSAPFLIDKVVMGYNSVESLVNEDYERTNIWKINPETKSDHPAPFPIKIPLNIIRYYSYINDIVLDPFMGSGTTGVACVQTDRSFIGIEIDPDYFKIAEKRIAEAQMQPRLF